MFASTRRVSCGLPVGKCVCVCVKECVSGGRKCRLHAGSEGHSHSCLRIFFFGRDGWPLVPTPLYVYVSVMRMNVSANVRMGVGMGACVHSDSVCT